MPRRGGRLNGRFNDEADSQPLFVSSREDHSTRTSSSASASADNVLFSVDDNDNDDDRDDRETSALAPDDTLRRTKADQTVRFQEHVQVIAPPLRSTLESREAGAFRPRPRPSLAITHSPLRSARSLGNADQRDSPARLFFSFLQRSSSTLMILTMTWNMVCNATIATGNSPCLSSSGCSTLPRCGGASTFPWV